MKKRSCQGYRIIYMGGKAFPCPKISGGGIDSFVLYLKGRRKAARIKGAAGEKD
jgi:hypothetical protein